MTTMMMTLMMISPFLMMFRSNRKVTLNLMMLKQSDMPHHREKVIIKLTKKNIRSLS